MKTLSMYIESNNHNTRNSLFRRLYNHNYTKDNENDVYDKQLVSAFVYLFIE